jgi:hypothetical protein
MSSITIDPSKINSFQNISINNSKHNTQNNNLIKGNSNTANNQNKKESGLMQNLLKQKQELNEEKQTLAAKKMDSKEKKAKMDELNKKIKDVDSQIQQLKVQEKQEEIQKKQEEIEKKRVKEETYTKNNYETKDNVILSASLSELIKVKGSKETIHLLKDSKNRQTIEAEYIEPNNIPNSYDNKRLSEIGTSIANLNMTIYKKIGDLNKSSERIQAKTELALKQLNDTNSDNDVKVNDKNTLNGVLKDTRDNESLSADDNNTTDSESVNNQKNDISYPDK